MTLIEIKDLNSVFNGFNVKIDVDNWRNSMFFTKKERGMNDLADAIKSAAKRYDKAGWNRKKKHDENLERLQNGDPI